MVNNVIGVVNYVIAARPSLLNFVIADTCSRTAPGKANSASTEHEPPSLACSQPYVGKKGSLQQLPAEVTLLPEVIADLPVGLYAEQISRAGQQQRNIPQALTHTALISAALKIDRALRA
jgi:hypothetical protein